MILSLIGLAHATSAFDPTSPEQVFTGQETYTQEGDVQLWSAIERHHDSGSLLKQEAFNSMTAWQDASWSPWINTCFGGGTPDSGSFLLHLAPGEASASGTPVLFVPGAGDNGSRGFITMATKMDQQGRPAYVLTFAHTHGDMFMQAEVVADAIARIKQRTGASQVDVVAHSKGGIAATLYASHHSGADWGGIAYESQGTEYRGDIRRLVLIGTPLKGVDTLYRWSGNNYAALSSETAISPASWSSYYPYTTGAPAWVTDLSDQDMLPDGQDLFPGQRQLLAVQDHPLPGELPWLGAYSLQQDWWTTYYGGFGYYSYSTGIDDAIEAGGDLIARLEQTGIDPDIEAFLLAGENPLMANGAEYIWTAIFGETWVDWATWGTDAWADLYASAIGDTLEPFGLNEDEVQGLMGGKLILGELTGPSDGVVFLDSATYDPALTARGAKVVEEKVVNLSHLDLLYASPVTGQLMIDEGNADPQEDGWQRAVGARYMDADTLGWLVEVLADPEPVDTGDTGDTGEPASTDDTGVTSDTDDSGSPADTGAEDSGGSDRPEGSTSLLSCGVTGSERGVPLGALSLALGVGLLLLRRRD
ncbi:MAG: hypothetical protein VX899_10215 [Myxococcota bacterium]|nr:hypothetical protein [Myxococcota bacterium]